MQNAFRDVIRWRKQALGGGTKSWKKVVNDHNSPGLLSSRALPPYVQASEGYRAGEFLRSSTGHHDLTGIVVRVTFPESPSIGEDGITG